MFNKYVSYLKSIRNLSVNTIRAYSEDIELYNQFLKKNNMTEDHVDMTLIR